MQKLALILPQIHLANNAQRTRGTFASYKLVGSAADVGDDSEGHGTHIVTLPLAPFCVSLATSFSAVESLGQCSMGWLLSPSPAPPELTFDDL